MSSAHYKRQPRNVLGQWIPELARGPSGVCLTPVDGDSAGYIDRAVAPASSTRNIDQWWDRAFDTGAYNHRGTVPHMPDDYTPARTSGRALSGRRRTHRMRYCVADGQVRMPSRTSVLAFMDETDSHSVDVPVVYSAHGTDVSAWVCVTRNADGSIEARTRGADGRTDLLIAESVSASLERRHVEVTSVDDLYERRQARRALYGTTAAPMGPSFITGADYDETTHRLTIAIGENAYQYTVDPATYRRLAESPRPGAVYNRLVKGTGESTKLRQCGVCGRYANDRHVCPVKESKAYAESTFAQHVAARAKRKPCLRRHERPDVSSWMEPPTGEATGWTRAAVAGVLYDYADRRVVPTAFLNPTDDGSIDLSGRNGENGTLMFDQLTGRDAAKLASLMPPGDPVGDGDLVRAATRDGVSVSGEAHAPSTGREGICVTSMSVCLGQQAELFDTDDPERLTEGYEAISKTLGLRSNRRPSSHFVHEGVVTFLY